MSDTYQVKADLNVLDHFGINLYKQCRHTENRRVRGFDTARLPSS